MRLNAIRELRAAIAITHLMDEHIWTAVDRCDEAPSFGHVEPLAFASALAVDAVGNSISCATRHTIISYLLHSPIIHMMSSDVANTIHCR